MITKAIVLWYSTLIINSGFLWNNSTNISTNYDSYGHGESFLLFLVILL